MHFRLQLTILVLCTIALLLMVSGAEACPGCKDAIAENDDASYNIARGYFWSILFMMSMPFLILSTFGSYIYIELRRAKKDRQAMHDAAAGTSRIEVGTAD